MASHTTEWILKLVDKATKPLRDISGGAEKASKSYGRVNDALKQVQAIDYYATTQALQEVNRAMETAVAPALIYEDGLADLEAITGVTGKALDNLGLRAKKSAGIFGGSASDSLNTYKSILSELGPAIAQHPEVLAKMEQNARTLSKTMNNDLGAATDALNTAMLQYNVDLSDATAAQKEQERMMNIMAAGAKEGAAEVNHVAAALRVSGVQAYNSNVKFEELNSAIQELARGGKKGAEGGTALRNVLGKMAGEEVISASAVKRLKSLGVDMSIVSNKTLPLTTRLRELKKAEADATIFAEMFGTENEAAARILIRSADAQDELTKKIVGTNTAFEQAEIKMNTWSEMLSRGKARMENLLISVGGSLKYLVPAVQLFTGLGQSVATVGAIKAGLLPVMVAFKKALFGETKEAGKTTVAFSGLTVGTSGLAGAQTIATGTSWTLVGGLKAVSMAIKSIPVVGWILAAISALIALFTYLWNTSATFRGIIKGIWEIVKTTFQAIWDFVRPIVTGIFQFVVSSFLGIWNTVKTVITNVWNFLRISLGFVSALFNKVFGGAWDNVKKVFDKIWEKIQEFLKRLLDSPMGKILSKIFGFSLSTIKLKINEEQKKEAEGKNSNANKFDFANLTEDPKTPVVSGGSSSGGTGSGSGTSSSGAKIINMALNVTNSINVADGKDFWSRKEEVLDYIVGRINDGLKDALITTAN